MLVPAAATTLPRAKRATSTVDFAKSIMTVQTKESGGELVSSRFRGNGTVFAEVVIC